MNGQISNEHRKRDEVVCSSNSSTSQAPLQSQSHTRGIYYALKCLAVVNARCLAVKTAIVQPEATLMESNFEAQSARQIRKERNILAMPDPSDLSEFQSPRTQCALEDGL